MKSRFEREINKNASRKFKNILKLQDDFIKHDQLSKPLSKPKELTKARNKNRSLDLFCASIEDEFFDFK